MNTTELLIFLGIGAVSGWLAGVLMRGGGYGLIGDIVVGIVGAIFGGYIFGLLGITVGSGLTSLIITAVIGAMVLITLIRLIKRILT